MRCAPSFAVRAATQDSGLDVAITRNNGLFMPRTVGFGLISRLVTPTGPLKSRCSWGRARWCGMRKTSVTGMQRYLGLKTDEFIPGNDVVSG